MTNEAVPCKFCGGPCPPTAPNARQPRVFCRNACRAQWRVQERNLEIQAARDQVQEVVDALDGIRSKLTARVDALDALIVHPRRRRRPN